MAVGAYHKVLLSAVATDETASDALGPAVLDKLKHHIFLIEWGTGVSAGVVTLETASHADATVWAPLTNGVITFTGTAPNSQYLQVEGAFLALRARVSTAVADGTVTVTYFGN